VDKATSSSRNPTGSGVGWIARRTAWLARIGADDRDGEELRQKKALLVTLAVLILPISAVWGVLYLSLGSLVGVAPFVYFAISLGSLVVFARTRRFELLLVTQLLDILLMPTAGGQMLVGGFLPSGGVGLWGILAPLGALVFLGVKQAVRWFGAFVVVFLLTGVAGEVLFSNAHLPVWFTSTMLASNVIGTASVAFTVLASFAHQRNAALTALRAEQEKSEALLLNVLPRPIAERLKAGQTIADHFAAASILFADVVDFTPLSSRLNAREVVLLLDRLFTSFDELVDRYGVEKIKTIGDCYMVAAGVPRQRPDHAHALAGLALEMRECAKSCLPTGTAHDLRLRIGISSGPVVAGVIGRRRFLYDLWGDTVNMASRMESHGTPDAIQITRSTWELLRDDFVLDPLGADVKGKGVVETWRLVGPRDGRP
jgi:adenylate cyclase